MCGICAFPGEPNSLFNLRLAAGPDQGSCLVEMDMAVA